MRMLIILVSWLTALFISFGLYAPTNGTVVTSLLVSALSVSAAIFLILELYSPYHGLIRILARRCVPHSRNWAIRENVLSDFLLHSKS